MLYTIFGLLLRDIMDVYIVTINSVSQMNLDQDTLIMDVRSMNEHPSRGIASFIYVGSMGRARIDVFSNDIDSLLLSLFVLIPILVGTYVIGISID
jgi:hypothetical protein